MNKSHRFLISVLLLGAYLLSACSGTAPLSAPQQDDGSSASQSVEVVFTGSVEAMGASQWTISGQVVGVEGASIDANIQVGDIVKVEASVAADGSIFALRIEAARPAIVDGNANDDMNGNTNDDMNGNANDDMNGNANDDMNGNANESPDDEQEIYGVVEALASDSITVSGVTYMFASFTEFKTIVSVGDQVKLHVVVASDGTLVVREIERTLSDSDDDNSNSNSNSNDNDDDDSNSNQNSNDDDDDDNSNSNGNQNSNDDDDDNDNSNDNQNSNDDDDDDNSNSNDNSNDNDDD
ncbi:MAG: hypothetical protein HXY42_03870 [Chloroflexi bacterium]|nr:hypothetical protein [Chloroflexota bacterium]